MFRVERIGRDRLDEYLSLLRERAAWLEAKGQPMWNPAYLEPEAFAERYRDPACFLAHDGGCAAVGGFALAGRDDAWGEDSSNTLYIHKLVVRGACAGRGYARLMLEWILSYAADAGRDSVRLDYYEDRDYLAKLYASCGFAPLRTDVMPDGTRIVRAERGL